MSNFYMFEIALECIIITAYFAHWYLNIYLSLVQMLLHSPLGYTVPAQ